MARHTWGRGGERLFLIRHCEAAGQDATARLTAAGHAQAIRLADQVAALKLDLDLIVSSPYVRAQQTIAPLAERLRLPVRVDPRLAERVLSTEPLPDWREAMRRTFADLDLTLPGGESSRAAMARGRAAIDALLARSEGVAAVVTHGNLMTLMLRSFETRFGVQARARLSNPDVYCLVAAGERLEIARIWDPKR